MVGKNGTGLAKSLTFMAGADAAGIVFGARVPIILTSPADSLIARLAFCAMAALVAAARRQDASKVIAWSCVLLRGHVASGCDVSGHSRHTSRPVAGRRPGRDCTRYAGATTAH
jgi:hypothetical protein